MTLLLRLIISLITTFYLQLPIYAYGKSINIRDPFYPIIYPACVLDKHFPTTLTLQGVIGWLPDWKGWFHSTEYGWFPMNVGETLPSGDWLLIQQTQQSAIFSFTGEQGKQCQSVPILTLELIY